MAFQVLCVKKKTSTYKLEVYCYCRIAMAGEGAGKTQECWGNSGCWRECWQGCCEGVFLWKGVRSSTLASTPSSTPNFPSTLPSTLPSHFLGFPVLYSVAGQPGRNSTLTVAQVGSMSQNFFKITWGLGSRALLNTILTETISTVNRQSNRALVEAIFKASKCL